MNRSWPAFLFAAIVGVTSCASPPKTSDRVAATPAGFLDANAGPDRESESQGLPLLWKIGDIDRRFEIESETVRRAIERACAVWEDEARKDLFRQDLSFGFPIHFVFDHRQEHILASLVSEENLRQAKQRVVEARQVREASEREFLRAKSSFDAWKVDFETRLDAYNRQVALVNARGGATESEAARLDREKARLESDRAHLESLRQDVLRLQDETNFLSQSYNDLVRQSNTLVAEHNQRFGGVMQTIGECVRAGREVRRINIYGFEDHGHLAIVLAHELGHALGLEHVRGAGAIMSEVEGGEKGSESLKLTDRDRNELHRRLAERK